MVLSSRIISVGFGHGFWTLHLFIRGGLSTWMGVWLLAWELSVTFEGGDTDCFWRTSVSLLSTFNQTM